MPVVERDVKTVEIFWTVSRDATYEFLRREPFALRLEHDRRAVSIIGAHEMHLIADHALESHPDIRLDVLHDVTDVKRPVGVRKCSRYEQLTRGRHW